MRRLEAENAQLKRIVAQQAMDIDALIARKKMVSPQARRIGVKYLVMEKLSSERRGCWLLGVSRGCVRYEVRRRLRNGWKGMGVRVYI